MLLVLKVRDAGVLTCSLPTRSAGICMKGVGGFLLSMPIPDGSESAEAVGILANEGGLNTFDFAVGAVQTTKGEHSGKCAGLVSGGRVHCFAKQSEGKITLDLFESV